MAFSVFILIIYTIGVAGILGIIYSIVKKNLPGFIISIITLSVALIIIVPPFIPMSEKARQGCVKANMHTLELLVNDYRAKNNGLCPPDTIIFKLLPNNLKNPQTFKPYSRFLKTNFAAKSLNEPSSKNNGYMLGYATSRDNAHYIILGTGKNGQLIHGDDHTTYLLTNIK
ncbi:MAG: hypothetical protein Q7U71_03165 [bacterium]|nr:hypothetical protein [bacterium]